jgi:hypothetical protein
MTSAKKKFEPGSLGIEQLKPGDICTFERYPFYVIYSNSIQTDLDSSMKITDKTISTIFDYESIVYEIGEEDKFFFLKPVTVLVHSVENKLGEFLYESQRIYLTEEIIVDSLVTVETII